MKTTTVSLGQHFDEFVKNAVQSGRYSNNSEVIRCALRDLEKKEKALQELDTLLEHSIERGGGQELTPESYYKSYQERRARNEESNIPA
jgi:antitoxin ParD1/3/4